MALCGATGLRGGVNESRSPEKALAAASAEDETKVGEETKRVLEEPEIEANEDAAGVAGDGVVLR